jgi:tRNA(Ile)-lysidine synthase
VIATGRAWRARAARHPISHALHAALDALHVPEGARVVVAVSGGADSMALLAAAAGLVGRGRLQPVIVHVDHGLRPESADEGALVAAACARADLPCERVRVDLGRERGNMSARARTARYRALAACARAQDAPWIATAHHADDQLETMVMALGRGMGLARLGGMRAARPLPEGGEPDSMVARSGARVVLIRPFLGLPRGALREACGALGLAWCEDPGNAVAARPRGVVRHRIAPALESTWPGCAARAARTAVTLQWAAARLEREARALLRRARREGAPDVFDRATLRAAPLPVLAAAVRTTIRRAARRGPASGGARRSRSGATAWTIAEAVADSTLRPRRWRLACGVEVRVGARDYRAGASSLGGRQRS